MAPHQHTPVPGETADEHRRRGLSVRYRKAHTRGAYRVRWDAYDLAVLYLSTGRAHLATPKQIHAQINGGRCAFAPVRAAIADARRDCAPTQTPAAATAATDPRDLTTCTECGARLIRHWTSDGMDFTWLDEAGSRLAGQGGPPGIDSIEDYLDWLRAHDMRGYSAFLAQVTLGAGLLPWQHWHRPAPVIETGAGFPPLPWCCGEPARRVRDGWICREDPQHRPAPSTAV